MQGHCKEWNLIAASLLSLVFPTPLPPLDLCAGSRHKPPRPGREFGRQHPTGRLARRFRVPGCLRCLAGNSLSYGRGVPLPECLDEQSASASKAPVMVWIHGGGNVEGSQEMPPLGPTLAKHGVVVVSINYRLERWGLCLPCAFAESAQHSSGNYGLQDQLEALKWVRRNIDKFGGDPAQVTVFAPLPARSTFAT